MSQIQKFKEILSKKFEAEKNDMKLEIEENFSFIMNAIEAMKKKELYEMEICEIEADSQILEEQSDVKESELTEFDEGDLKSSLNYVYELKRDNRKIELQFQELQSSLMEAYNQSEAVIAQMIKYKRKLAEIPAIKEAEQSKAKTTLENLTLKLNAIKQESKDCHEEEKSCLVKITEKEGKLTEVLKKSEELTNSINVESALANKVAQFKEEIIPDIANEIEKVKINITSIENVIADMNEANENAIKIFDEIKEKVEIAQAKDTSLRQNLHNMMQLKNDIVNNNISLKDIEEHPNLQNVANSDEYKKQMETIKNLTTDNEQIFKDAQEAKRNKVESEHTLKNLMEVTNQVKDISRIKNDEVIGLEKDIEDKEAELKTLNDEIMEIEKAKSTHEQEKELIEKEIAELTAAYEELNEKLNDANNDTDSEQNEEESALKTVDMKVSANNNKNTVHKWLNDLPQKFTMNTERSDILTQNSTANFDDSNLNISTVQIQSKDTRSDSEDSSYDLEIEDPEEIDANMECSFSDINGSEIGLDDSLVNNTNNQKFPLI